MQSMEEGFDTANLKKPEFTPVELIYRYIKYLPWVILSLVIALVLAFINLRYTPEVYSARGQMVIKSESPFSSGDEKFNQLFLMDNGPNLNNEMIILRSSSMVQRVVKDLGLETEYSGIGNVRTTHLYSSNPIRLETVQRKDSGVVSFKITIMDEYRFKLNEEE